MIFKRILLVIIVTSAYPVKAGFDGVVKQFSLMFNTPAWVVRHVCTHESQSYFKGKRQPWPWTVNVNGKGYWFKDKHSASMFAQLTIMSGTTNIDVGICQINWRWHGKHFKSVKALMDPITNIEYAVKYLNKIKGDRSWKYAIGAYHSPNDPEKAA